MKPQRRSIKYGCHRDPMPRHSKTCISADFHAGRSGQPQSLIAWEPAWSRVCLPAGMFWDACSGRCLVLRIRGTGGRDFRLLCMCDDAAGCPVCLIRHGTDPDIQVSVGMIRAALGFQPADS